MKKLLFMLLAAFLLPVAVKAQNIAYSYDAAGNRILRALEEIWGRFSMIHFK
jgi:hypothetical protein